MNQIQRHSVHSINDNKKWQEQTRNKKIQNIEGDYIIP